MRLKHWKHNLHLSQIQRRESPSDPTVGPYKHNLQTRQPINQWKCNPEMSSHSGAASAGWSLFLLCHLVLCWFYRLDLFGPQIAPNQPESKSVRSCWDPPHYCLLPWKCFYHLKSLSVDDKNPSTHSLTEWMNRIHQSAIHLQGTVSLFSSLSRF